MSKKITHEHMKNLVSRTYNTLVYYFNDDNALKFEKELKKWIIKLEDLIETFDNYILQLNARIKINKEIIEENFDLNPSLCHDLEVENTALEFALMLLEGEIR